MEPSQDSQTSNTASAANVSTWPGAFGIYKTSRDAVRLNIGPYLLLLLIVIAISIVLPSLVGENLSGLVSWLINAFFVPATVVLFLAGLKGQKVSFEEASNAGFKFFLKSLVLSLLVFLAVGLSLLLLIVPFFFVLPRLMLANYFLVDKDMDIIDAFKASWDNTKGHSLKVWGIILVNILMALLMITIIGIPLALYLIVMYSAAFAALYLHIGKQPGSPSTTAPAPTDPAPAA